MKATNALGGNSTNAYDANGNLTLTTNRENEWVKYEYDAMNRLVKQTNQLNNANAYTYDPAGNTMTYSDGNHHITTYAYDGVNRIVSVTDAVGNLLTDGTNVSVK